MNAAARLTVAEFEQLTDEQAAYAKCIAGRQTWDEAERIQRLAAAGRYVVVSECSDAGKTFQLCMGDFAEAADADKLAAQLADDHCEGERVFVVPHLRLHVEPSTVVYQPELF